MNLSFLKFVPEEWRMLCTVLLFPIGWLLWTFSGSGYELILKIIFLFLPILFLCVSVFCTILSLVTVIFRSDRQMFVATVLIGWWDGGKSILIYWAGIFKLLFFSIGWISGAIRIVAMGFFQTLKDIVFLPATIILRMLRGYASPGIPWIAVFITLMWIILESLAFSFILRNTIVDIISSLAHVEFPPIVAFGSAFIFLFMFIGGSFACMHGLVEAIEKKDVGNIIKMLSIEFFVMFIEVMFFYREFVSSLAPFLAQMTDDSFQMNIWHILTISSMAWFGVRAGIWFFFAKYGTPTLLMIISREGILNSSNQKGIKIVGEPLLWIKSIVKELRGEIDWFSEKGNEILEAIILPPVQILACMTNFVMVLLTGNNLFSLPIRTIQEIKDSNQLVAHIRKEGQK